MSQPDYDAEFTFPVTVRVRHWKVGGTAVERLEENVRAEVSKVLNDFFFDCGDPRLPSDQEVEIDSVEVGRATHVVNR